MKKVLLLLSVCLSLSFVLNAQTKKPVRKAATTAKKTSTTPSANGKFKFSIKGFLNDTDQKDYVVITAPGKSARDIKSSVVSTLSSMYSNPSKVISTLGDNIINVNGYASDAFVTDAVMSYKHYSFSYNIKIEVKDGKIKIDTPSFSRINERDVPLLGNASENYIDTYSLFNELSKAGEQYQAKVENIFNAHITKIISGLSSDSDW